MASNAGDVFIKRCAGLAGRPPNRRMAVSRCRSSTPNRPHQHVTLNPPIRAALAPIRSAGNLAMLPARVRAELSPGLRFRFYSKVNVGLRERLLQAVGAGFGDLGLP